MAEATDGDVLTSLRTRDAMFDAVLWFEGFRQEENAARELE